MAKKIIGAGLAAVVLIIILGMLLREDGHPEKVESPNPISEKPSPQASSIPEKSDIAASPVVVASGSETNSFREKISKLQENSTRNDSQSLQLILAELTNSIPEIREAALDAAIQFGSGDAIPVLKDLAANTENAREKVAILDAIEFLELPSFGEIKSLRQTNSSAGEADDFRK